MNANTDENIANLNIFFIMSYSESGSLASIIRTSVEGAFLSDEALSLKSLSIVTGLVLISLCSTIFFTLERNKNEFITAGNNAITPIISELPAIDNAPYMEPNNKVPESPGKILLGNRWNLYNAKVPKKSIRPVRNTSMLPKIAILQSNGTIEISKKPVTTPLKTSIEFIVFPTIGIISNISGIYNIGIKEVPKMRFKCSLWAPRNTSGNPAAINATGLNHPGITLISST